MFTASTENKQAKMARRTNLLLPMVLVSSLATLMVATESTDESSVHLSQPLQLMRMSDDVHKR